MLQQNIFGDRNFKQRLACFSLTEVDNLEAKTSLISKYIKALESGRIEKTKEKAIQADFLNKFFGDILEYDYNDSNHWNIEKECKSFTDGTQADGALGFFSIDGKNINADVRVVIELKDASTDLDKPQSRQGDKRTPVEQAFSYSSKAGGHCKWVIVSNFKEIRFYHASDQSRYENFVIRELLNPDKLKCFFFLLQKERLISKDSESFVDALYRERQEAEQIISKQFYNQYKNLRIELFEHLKQNNTDKDKLLLLTKSQKLLDRFIFICFCEDKNLLPAYTSKKVKDILKNAFDFYPYKLWRQLSGLFQSIAIGNKPLDIEKFNGGLFAKDDDLDNLTIKDDILLKLIEIAEYDFDSDLNVNILGHIFEQSLSDIEELKTQIGNGNVLSNEEKSEIRKNGKRKKDGIFYTPEYITRYIVKEAVGDWLENRKQELGFYDLPELTTDDIASIKPETKKGNKLKYNANTESWLKFWEAYKEQLQNIKVLDPACGSGAFLNQAFDYLYAEGQKVNDKLSRLRLGQREVFELDRHILTNNLFGVDLNPESVEITKLSLWLKTANRGKELTALDENIKCGNSLIDDPIIAGEKAFNWFLNFPSVFRNYRKPKEQEMQTDVVEEPTYNYGNPQSKGFEKFGFDIIIGNPPYVSANNMSFAEREFFNKESEYKTLSGKWDLYIPFVERSLSLLKQGGKQCFIIPFGILNQPFGKKLRKHILDEFKVLSIVDLRDIKVFQDSTVPTCIPLIDKAKSESYCVDILRPFDFNFEKAHEIEIEKYKTANLFMFRTENLDQSQSILNKIRAKAQNITLGDLFYVSTGAEIHGKEKRSKEGTLESGHSKFDVLSNTYKEGFKEYIEGSAIEKSKQGRYCYPKRDAFLNYEPKIMRSPKFPELFDSEKLIIRRSSGLMGILATLDERKLYTSEKCILILNKSNLPQSNVDFEPQANTNLKYLLTLLNSSLFHFYYSSVFGGFIDVYPNSLKALSVPKLKNEEQQPFIEKADIMLSKNKQLHEIRQSFILLVQSEWPSLKITGKLDGWYKLSFEDFRKELEKQKIKLILQEQAEWLQYFNEQKQKAEFIQNIIVQTDKEIDNLVYQLYELTAEEIKIIENVQI